MNKIIIISALLFSFVFTGCKNADTSRTVNESKDDSLVYTEATVVTYTDETVALDIYFNEDANISIQGQGKIVDKSFVPDDLGTTILKSDNSTLTITVKDPSTRIKDYFYYAGEIIEENGQKYYVTNEGDKYLCDFYKEIDVNDKIDFSEFLDDIEHIEFVAGTKEVYSKDSDTFYSFTSRGDAVFKIKSGAQNKTVLIHVECGDCKK